MKVELFEWQYGFDIKLIPESVEEVGKLLRFSNSAKKEKVSFSTWFSKDVVFWCNVARIKNANNVLSSFNKIK